MNLLRQFVDDHLGIINFLILQWFFVRLTRSHGYVNGQEVTACFKWMIGPLPLTGWISRYIDLTGKIVLRPRSGFWWHPDLPPWSPTRRSNRG